MASFSFFRSRFTFPTKFRRGTKAYDFAAGLPLIVIYALGAVGKVGSLRTTLSGSDAAPLTYLQLIDILSDVSTLLFALLFIGFVVLRPPALASASGLLPRIAAVAGTYLAVALVLLPAGHPSSWITSVSTILVFSGMAFCVYSVSFLGRSVSVVAEARRLVTGGPYKIIRHPLYLGEEMAIAGAVLQYFSIWAFFLFAVQVAFQIYRMSCEEKILAAAFPEYDAYKLRTYRILPGLI